MLHVDSSCDRHGQNCLSPFLAFPQCFSSPTTALNFELLGFPLYSCHDLQNSDSRNLDLNPEVARELPILYLFLYFDWTPQVVWKLQMRLSRQPFPREGVYHQSKMRWKERRWRTRIMPSSSSHWSWTVTSYMLDMGALVIGIPVITCNSYYLLRLKDDTLEVIHILCFTMLFMCNHIQQDRHRNQQSSLKKIGRKSEKQNGNF